MSSLKAQAPLVPLELKKGSSPESIHEKFLS